MGRIGVNLMVVGGSEVQRIRYCVDLLKLGLDVWSPCVLLVSHGQVRHPGDLECINSLVSCNDEFLMLQELLCIHNVDILLATTSISFTWLEPRDDQARLTCKAPRPNQGLLETDAFPCHVPKARFRQVQ